MTQGQTSLLMNAEQLKTLRKEIDNLNKESRLQRIYAPHLSYELAVKAYELAKPIDYLVGLGYAALNIGFHLYYIKGQLAEGNSKLQEAHHIFGEINDEVGLAWGTIIKASTTVYAGEYDKSFTQYNNALEVFIRYGEKDGEVLTRYLLGNIYLELKEYEKAAAIHEQCLLLYYELNDAMGISNALTSLAIAYHANENYEKAIEYFEKSIKVAQESRNMNAEARAWHDFGLVYESLGDYNKAIELIELALQQREKQGQKQGIITCCLSLGRLYYRMQDFDYAVARLEQAIVNGTVMNAKPKLMRAYSELANIYKDLGNAWKALDCYEKYMEMKTAVLGEETTLQMKKIQSTYETEQAKKETEIERLRNVELKEAYHKIEHQNQHIIDSIKYAKRIQEAILEPIETVTESIGYEAFILYRAKDIVSGDFYWYGEIENKFSPEHKYKIIIAADCTGHGVPGAFMTVMGNDFLNDIVLTHHIYEPAQIIYQLDEKVGKTLRKQGGDRQPNDGMDIAIMTIDELNQKVYFAGAKNPMYLVRNNEIKEVKGSKFPIGSNQYRLPKHFENYVFELRKGDMYYIATDGYQDQFGQQGKFMKRRFRELLLHLSQKPLEEQKNQLLDEVVKWQGTKPQTDDWLVIGVRV